MGEWYTNVHNDSVKSTWQELCTGFGDCLPWESRAENPKSKGHRSIYFVHFGSSADHHRTVKSQCSTLRTNKQIYCNGHCHLLSTSNAELYQTV